MPTPEYMEAGGFCTFLTANRDEMRGTLAVDSWMDYHSVSLLISCSSSTKVLEWLVKPPCTSMEPGCLLLLIAVKMQSAKNTVPKASKNTMKPIGIAFSKPCYVSSAGLSLHASCRFLHSQHAILPLLIIDYRRRTSVKLPSEKHSLWRERLDCKLP